MQKHSSLPYSLHNAAEIHSEVTSYGIHVLFFYEVKAVLHAPSEDPCFPFLSLSLPALEKTIQLLPASFLPL